MLLKMDANNEMLKQRMEHLMWEETQKIKSTFVLKIAFFWLKWVWTVYHHLPGRNCSKTIPTFSILQFRRIHNRWDVSGKTTPPITSKVSWLFKEFFFSILLILRSETYRNFGFCSSNWEHFHYFEGELIFKRIFKNYFVTLWLF